MCILEGGFEDYRRQHMQSTPDGARPTGAAQGIVSPSPPSRWHSAPSQHWHYLPSSKAAAAAVMSENTLPGCCCLVIQVFPKALSIPKSRFKKTKRPKLTSIHTASWQVSQRIVLCQSLSLTFSSLRQIHSHPTRSMRKTGSDDQKDQRRLLG